MASSTRESTYASGGTLWRVTLRILAGIQVLVVLAAVGAVAYFVMPFAENVAKSEPPPLPPTMEAVDWHDPGSSQYCIACHKQVSIAMAGLDVERGHSQNVALDDRQLAAIEEMGTIAGPEHTLICMSCHTLGEKATERYMLAETLEDSALCQRCHPGHYARGTPHDLRISAPDARNRLGQTVAEGGPCSACHLAHRYALEIERSPLDPEGYCLPCHATYGIAAAHHPRTTMDHPESRCRDCHDPHDMTHGEFLHEPVNELCVRCHAGYGDGLAGGMHPLGPMDYAVPDEMLAAGAHPMGNPRELTCVICHDTHEAEHDALLHIPLDDNRLCLTCHEDKLLAQTHDQILPRHGQQPILTEQQKAVVVRWGNRVGPNNELLCISCHDVHGSVEHTQLLSFTPKYGETCIACHPSQESVAGSSHDLRVAHPDVPNDEGLTPLQAGVCSPCHMAHHFPRERVVTAGDPAGQCMTCHAEGGLAEDSIIRGAHHPETRCTECHDPHVRRYAAFLTSPEPQLCSACHPAQMQLVGGPHDFNQDPDAWPEVAQENPGLCLPCHVPHGGDRPDLFRVSAGPATAMHDEVCLGCHPAAGWGAASNIAAIHPQRIDPEHSHVDVALVPTDEAGEKRMGCRTCHAAHGSAEPLHLANVEPGMASYDLCLACHVEKSLIRFTGHSPEALAEAGYHVDSCKPCHAMHAAPDGSWGQVLSPRFLMEYCATDGPDPSACVPCLACHHPDSPAPIRDFAQHPEVLTNNVYQPGDPGYMPLFGPDGRVDPQGQITCRTCHVSHGRLDLLRLAQERELTDLERQSLNAQVREFSPPNLCTMCHGTESRAMFLYFHDPERRGQPTRGQTPQRLSPGE